MKRLTFPVFIIAGTACALFSPGDPRDVAEEFWLASQAGDVDRAREVVAEGGTARITEPDDGPAIDDFTLGDATVDGDDATVETTLSGLGDSDTEVSFETILVRQDGEWKVDLDRTTDEMMKAILGSSMRDIAGEMGRAIGEAMGEAVEGLAEGMQAAGESLAAAAERRKPDR